MAILICSRLLYPTRWPAETSENMSRRCFQWQQDISDSMILMKMKGLKGAQIVINIHIYVFDRNFREKIYKFYFITLEK